MKATNFSVKFEADVQSTEARFSVPEAVCHLLDVDCGDELDLVIRDTSGKLLYGGRKLLTSGKEACGEGFQKIVPGQRIRVEASLP